MAWEFEDTGQTRICRNIGTSYGTLALGMSCLMTVFFGLPLVISEIKGETLPQGDLPFNPLYIGIGFSIVCLLISFFVNDEAVVLELDNANGTLHFRTSCLFSSRNLRITSNKVEGLSLEKVTTKTFRKVAGQFQAKSEAAKIGKANISRKDFLSLRIADGSTLLITSAGPHAELEENSRNIAKFFGLHLETRETEKEESYTVNKRLIGEDKVDFFS